MNNYFEVLSFNPVFQGVSPEEIEKLFKDKIFRIRKIDRGEYAVHATETVENLLFVVYGSVRGEMTDFSGKTIKIEDISAPRPIAPAFIFGKQNRYPVDIIANEPSVLFVLPKDSLIKLFQENATILKNFLDAVSNRAQFLSDKIRFLSFKTIKGKIASYLMKVLGKTEGPFILPQNQTQLADYFGVTRPSLARALGELTRDGILEIDNKEVIIKDKKKLIELIQ